MAVDIGATVPLSATAFRRLSTERSLPVHRGKQNVRRPVRQTPGVHATRRIAIAAALVGVVAAVAAALVGVVLADIYRPHSPGALTELPGTVRRSDRWTDWHRTTSGVVLAAAAVTLATVGALVAHGKSIRRRKALVVGAAIAAVAMSLVTVISRPAVEWDQLALSSVTVDSDIDGYWTAAFGDDVLFVLIGDVEVSQGDYGAVLVAHLAAPFVTGIMFILLGTAVRHARDNGSRNRRG